MSHLMLAFPNRAADATYTGVGWLPTLPLSHLGTRQLSQRARSTRTTATFFADLGLAKDCEVAALAGHSFTTAGQWRIQGYDSDPREAYQTISDDACMALDFGSYDSTLPDGYTLATTRSGTTATYFNSSGVLVTTTTANTPRITYDPTTGACEGLMCEASSTNTLTWSRDLTNAVWTKSASMTAAKTATGMDAVANSATRLTAGAANQTASHAYSSTSSTFSLYIKRVTGAGSIQISTDGGVSYTTLSAPSSSVWTRYIKAATAGSSSVIIRIATSGDVIEVDGCQIEANPLGATSFIPTTTGSVTRNAESHVITIPAIQRPDMAEGLLLLDWYVNNGVSATGGDAVFRLWEDADSFITLESSTGSTADSGFETSWYVDSVGGNILGTQDSTLRTRSHHVLQWEDGAPLRYSREGAGLASSAGNLTTPTPSTRRPSEIRIAPGHTQSIHLRGVYCWRDAQPSANLPTLSTVAAGAAAAYDSGWLDAWPAAWVSATTTEQKSGARSATLHRPASTETHRYWRVDVSDSAVVDVGRLIISDAWSTAINAGYGLSIGYEPRVSVVEADSGAEYFATRQHPRVVRFALDWATEAEAMLGILEAQRQLSSSGELLFAFDPSDTTYLPMRCFVARMRAISPLVHPMFGVWSCSFELKELL